MIYEDVRVFEVLDEWRIDRSYSKTWGVQCLWMLITFGYQTKKNCTLLFTVCPFQALRRIDQPQVTAAVFACVQTDCCVYMCSCWLLEVCGDEIFTLKYWHLRLVLCVCVGGGGHSSLIRGPVCLWVVSGYGFQGLGERDMSQVRWVSHVTTVNWTCPRSGGSCELAMLAADKSLCLGTLSRMHSKLKEMTMAWRSI